MAFPCNKCCFFNIFDFFLILIFFKPFLFYLVEAKFLREPEELPI